MLRRAYAAVEGVQRPRLELIAALVLFSICAYLVAPFSFGDARTLAPQNLESDAILGTLLLGSGMDKLSSDPRAYYDTAILYPDRNQLRTTEPFLGFAVVGLPLRTLLHFNDSDVFEALRWVMVFASLVYAYLLFEAVGVDRAMSAAGAVLCLSQPNLLNSIERLQILCIPLILAVLYHGMMLWTSGRLRHSVGLFIFVALYPLCGLVNATLLLMIVLFVLPLLLKMLAAERRPKQLAACLAPIVLAAGLDAWASAPWLLDRSDLAVYVSDAFLEIKHWNTAQLPVQAGNIWGSLNGSIGLGMVLTLAIGLLLALRRVDRSTTDTARQPGIALPSQAYLSFVCVAVLGLSVGISFQRVRVALPRLQLLFHVVCYVTLLVYWWRQVRFSVSSDQAGIRNFVIMLSAGLGVFLCLMSFGPVYVSNDNPLASHIMRVLLDAAPPLRSVREYRRIWLLGTLFLSVYLTIRIGMALRPKAPIVRLAAAAIILVAVISSLYNRTLIASPSIEPPPDFFALASHSRATGGIYVHPRMQWNTSFGLMMTPAAKALGRPIVNGYLGIAPPWFGYASSVLHRFPDAESLWLLRSWKVATVVSLAGSVQVEDASIVDKVFENTAGAVYELAAPAGDLLHPSAGTCVTPETPVRIDATMSPLEHIDGGASLTVTVPDGFRTRRLQVDFRSSLVEQIPESIGVYAREGANRVRLNQDQSGDWIESLTADALLQRRWPVATIRLNASERRELEIEFRKAARQKDTDQSTYASWWHLSLPPIDRIGACGEWIHGAPTKAQP